MAVAVASMLGEKIGGVVVVVRLVDAGCEVVVRGGGGGGSGDRAGDWVSWSWRCSSAWALSSWAVRVASWDSRMDFLEGRERVAGSRSCSVAAAWSCCGLGLGC